MMRRIAPCFAALLVLGASTATAQPKAPSGAKKVLSVDDYARWRSVDNAIISSDGKWVAYGLRFSNTLPTDAKPVLHLRNIASGQETEITSATSPVFSADAKWVAYQVDPLPPARGAGRGAGAPANDSSTPPTVAPATPGGRGGAPVAAAAPRRWEIRELATGKVTAWQDVQSVTFSPTSSHALLRRRAGGAPAAGGAGGGPGGGPGGPGGGFGGRGDAGGAVARGADATLLDLATGRSQFFGSMGDGAFNRSGDYLAYTVDATVRDGNGLFLIELKSGRTQVLDNDSLRYSRLTWNDKGTGLAVLKGRDIDKMRERDNRLMVVSDLGAALASNARTPELLNPASTSGFPKGFVVSDRAPLQFSDDGARVFFGIIPQTATPDTARRRSTDSVPDVDVWRTQDERIQSQQMIQIDADRNRTFRQAYDVAANRYITLTDSAMREIELPITGNWAVGRDSRAYISDYKPATADFYRINTATGERTLMLKGQLAGRHVNGISPDGRVFLYWKDAKFQAYDLAAGTSRTLGGSTSPNFADMDEDHPVTRQPYGVSGYAADGSSVVVEHRYDLWVLPLDGSAARNLTGGVGTRDKISLRYVRTAPLDSSARRGARVAREIDLTKPITLSSFGEFTKKAGFSRLADGKVTSLVYEDAAFSTPLRAASADVFLLTRQTFSEFPDLVVSGNDFTDRKKISDANPQQAEYQWGRRVLFDYVTRRGDKLQGMLALPDDYKQGEKRPMLVNFYEKNSQNLNRYTPPSFLTGMGSMPIEAVSRGYITMVADVAFHTGSSHSDMLDAVEAATKKVIELGYADPKKIGVHGHSYGGEGAAFIGTRSRMFAAVGMGAGVTDLFTDFSQSWGWSYQVTGGSGQNGNDYYMEGQGRWGFSPWDKPEVYHFESALTHVPEVTQPFLIMHGTADPTVSFSEGMNFYNALRFNRKEATMLAYPGEGHGLRGMANRKDLTTRYFQFFDHYLKGSPAPSWMTDGVPYIVKTAPPKPTPVITP
jgi:esterase/lipase